MFRLLQEQARLKQLRLTFKTAEDLKQTSCVCCGYCCHRRSCIPSPQEVVKIAEFLKLTIEEMIEKYFVIDTMDGTLFYIKPVGENRLYLRGRIPSAEETFNEGKCIFLDENNKCKIHPVKPREAQEKKCWEKDESSYEGNKTWVPEDIYRIYPKAEDLIKQYNLF